MDKFKMLSGEQLVTQGAKKASASLPELGLKEVIPNGSWLEQKQIQNALEARKHLVEVERIDKLGALSHAHWREDLKLAEVTQKCGSHWQYLGHNIGKELYIKPEEALLLMEMNCLQLKYNDVIVSVQQAYSLLLGGKVSLVQYKVYASLSRLGYKVFRYDISQSNNTVNIEAVNTAKDSASEQESVIVESPKGTDLEDNTDCKNKHNPNVSRDGISTNIDKEEKNKQEQKENFIIEVGKINEILEVSSSENLCDEASTGTNGDLTVVNAEMCSKGSAAYIQNKLDILCSRELKPANSKVVHHSFLDNLPDLFQKHIITIKAPEEQYIPRNVFLNNTAYVLNIENLRRKNVIPGPSSSSQTYISSDDVNEHHVRRIRSSFSNESAQSNWTPPFFPNMRFSHQSNHFRQFNYWNHYQFNLAFHQRPFFPSMPLRFQVCPRMQQMFRFFPPPPGFIPGVNNAEPGRAQKRKRENTKKYHLESIKKLALKLKNLVQSGNRQEQNMQALQRLVHTYNIRYEARLQLTEQLEVVEDEIILETIELEDDDHSSPKRKKNADDKTFEKNFGELKKFTLKIKELEQKNESSPRHRRALSNAIKTFNKCYNADVYVDSNYVLTDRRHIVITSSSDSDCAVEKTPKPRKSKKLRNPFYIMKQLSEKQNATIEKESSYIDSDPIPKRSFKYSETLTNTFDKSWLPNEDDFGRAEVAHRNQMNNRLLDHSKDFLYEFMRSHLHNNWLDAKIAYWQSCKESAMKFEADSQSQSNLNFNSIVSPEDCTDLQSVLKKLSIIKTNKDIKNECPLSIDFDVYNRDVPNFKKTNKPKPHFRVICMEESSNVPKGVDLMTHRSKYADDVSVVFAIVNTASISYLQINPTELPLYIPTCNLP